MRSLILSGLVPAVMLGCGPTTSTGNGAGGTGGGPVCASATLRPGDSTGTIMVGGRARTYVLHVPASYTGQEPAPLVLDFHGLFLTGASQRNFDNYGTLADREGFVIAYPDGIDNAWNVGPCCTFSRDVDDLGFAKALVTKLSTDACIDPKRVYAVGYSMGAGMSYYLACNAPDVFAAVAPGAFDLLSEMPCAPSRPIPVISFRGTADPIVPYGGGASNPPNGLNTTIHFLGAEGTFQKWAELDQCEGAPVDVGGGCRTYESCAAGAEVTLCTSVGGGHVAGDADVAWQTLARHPLP